MTVICHKHIIVDAEVRNPVIYTDIAIDWMTRLIDAVGMTIVIGPYAHYCTAQDNEGITGTCCIETSHLSMHCWDKTSPPILRVDLYSCADFTADTIIKFIEEFDPIQLNFVILDRTNEINITQRGSASYD